MLSQARLQSDLKHCKHILAEGSKSFHAASWLLPSKLRDAAAAVYAFCRISDDAVDTSDDAHRALEVLAARLERIYQGTQDQNPIDRSFAWVVQTYTIPKQVPEALLEGFAWDLEGRKYENIEALEGYCVRVASTVGVMMTHVMGRKDSRTLSRACDLGIAMQLTNICRDVGEDAQMGRVYLPEDWLQEEGLSRNALLEDIRFREPLGRVVQRTLAWAEQYYVRADAGISLLPGSCRFAIHAARKIYADIGRAIAKNGFNSIDVRARTTFGRKLFLMLTSLAPPSYSASLQLLPAARPAAFLAEPRTSTSGG